MSGLSLQQQQAHRMSNRNTVETQTIKGCATRGQSINSGDGKVAGDLQNIELTENPPARQKGQENQETRKPRETLGATKLGQNYKGPPGQENPDIPDYPRAWFYPILPWGAPPSAFSRKRIRGHQLMIAWEFLILANVSYLMVEVPYTLTFALPYDHGLPVCEWTWKIAFDCFSCFVFAIDIVFQMHSAVFEGEVLGGHWHLVDKLSDIRWRYIKCMDPFARSFFWDIMCVIPFIQMSCVVWRESRAVLKTYPELYNPSTGLTLNLTTWVDARRAWWTQDPVLSNSKLISMITGWQILQALSLFRVLKVFRLWKLSETAAHVTRRSPVWAAVIAVANMIYYLFFSAHYLGCMWFWLGTPPPGAADFDSSWTNLEGRIWSEQEDGSFRRVLVANTDCDGWLIDVTRCGWLYEWSAAFYWAITTMTTIGYWCMRPLKRVGTLPKLRHLSYRCMRP